ncbi:MAG TPA: amidase [Caulobacteraceae bacterium]|nr:amidase [Caulobacteraceae bacterium]
MSEYPKAVELAAALRARRVSSVEIVEHAIGRIDAADAAINAVVVRDFERARTAARAADAAIARGEAGPLLGVPITVKEAFDVAGLPTTWGLPAARDAVAREDAVVVGRLKRAGAVVLGKTNVPTMLADWQCGNPVYGETSNPWRGDLTPGGSSGGGAAALAAGFVSLEYGSDLAASLRAPASFCGVYAHKPSRGLVPSRGFAPPGAPRGPIAPTIDLSALGPMARSAADLELALAVTAGPDTPDDIAWRLALPTARWRSLAEHRVLVIDEHPAIPTSRVLRGAIEDRARALARAGCAVAHASPLAPDLLEISVLFVELLLSQFSADSGDEAFLQAREEADRLAPDTDPLAAAGARAWALSHRDWVRDDRRRLAAASRWRELFESFDVVLCPAMPTNAFPKQAPQAHRGRLDVDGRPMPYDALPLWGAVATVTGLPATVVPLGLDASGIPVGAQVIGPYLEDLTTLRFSQLMEQEFGGFRPPPRL